MKNINILLSGIALAALLCPLSGQQIRLAGDEAARPASRAASSAEDQDQDNALLSAPALGYYVRGKHVRLMLGVPGAAHLSDTLPGLPGTARAIAAPGHDWVLTLSKQTAHAWRPETGESWPLPGVDGLPSATALSPSGREAAFYYEKDGRLLVYGGLPDHPELLHSAAHLLWPRGISELALAPGAAALAGLAPDGLYLLSPDPEATPVAIHSATGLRSLSFGASDARIAFLDSEAGALMVATRQNDSYFVQPAAGAGQGLSNPEHAAFDAAGLLWVASREAAALWRVDPATGTVERFDSQAPGRVERLRLRGALLVSSPEEPATQIALLHDGLAGLSWVPAPTVPAELAAVETAQEVRQ